MSTVIAPLEERGVSCSLDNYLILPDHTMDERIAAARGELGARAVHSGPPLPARRSDPLRRFSPATPTSFRKAASTSARIHRLLRRALHGGKRRCAGPDGQQVILPDLNAGCSMADMAEIGQVEDCWEQLVALGLTMTTAAASAADLYEFHGGDQGILRRARRAGLHLVERAPRHSTGRLRGKRRFSSCPTSIWAATPRFAMGIPMNEMVVWDP